MNVYDDVEIEDMNYDKASSSYKYECPCGDLFEITLDDLQDGEELAYCPSCTLVIRVIYDPVDFADLSKVPDKLPALVPKHDGDDH